MVIYTFMAEVTAPERMHKRAFEYKDSMLDPCRDHMEARSTLSRSRLSRPASMKGVSGVKSLGGDPKLSERYSVTTCRAAANSGAW